jgi:hypothetical protein
MTSAAQSDEAGHPGRVGFAVGPAIARVTRVARQHPVLLAAVVLVVGGGGAASAAVVLESSNPVPAIASVNCGTGVAGQGFRVSACYSGGVLAGHPHPKELLVVRNDGSSVAYPAYGGFGFAVGDGEVVAIYDDNLVRVTGRRLVTLVTRDELASALHRQAKTILVMGFGHLRLDARGDLYFFASTLIHGRHGCQSRYLERLTGGRILQIGASSAQPNNICY